MADRRTDTGPHRRIRTGCTWVASLLALVGVFGLSAARGQAVSGPVLAPPAGAAPGPAKAGAPSVAKPTEMVMDVQIRGNKSVPLDKILPQIRTRKNRPYDAELIQEDVRRLDRTHLFVDVKPSYQQVPGGRIVIFEVVERPLLKEIKFVGSKEISKKVLQKESKLKEGDAGRSVRDRGGPPHSGGIVPLAAASTGARVTLLEGNKPEDRSAIFLINEGDRSSGWS